MEKKTSPQVGLIWYELTEDEWYNVDDDQRNYLRERLISTAQRDGFAHANIMVTPDPVLSSSPTLQRHCVLNWHAKKPAMGETLDYWKQRAIAAEARLKELGETC